MSDINDGVRPSVWLIEKLWTDSLENEYSAALGYEAVGVAMTEEEADKIIADAGFYPESTGWPRIAPNTPKLRKREMPIRNARWELQRALKALKFPTPHERDLMEENISGPHCDPCVLHAPGHCKICDTFPFAQRLRVIWGINFSGEDEKGKLPCPSETKRSRRVVNAWEGNRAK